MPPDPTMSPATPSGDREAEIAVRGALLRSGPVFVIPRRIPGGVAANLDALSPEALPRLRFEGVPTDLRPRLSSDDQDATSASSRMRLGAVPFREGERSSTEGNGTAETALCGAGW